MSELLLQRIARGDATAVGPCIQLYGTLLWALARNATSTPAEAEDAVQDVFLEVWRRAGQYDVLMGPEVTFVSAVARHRLQDDREPLNISPTEELPPEPGGELVVTAELDEPLPQHLAVHLEEQAHALMQPATAVPNARGPTPSYLNGPPGRGGTLPPPALDAPLAASELSALAPIQPMAAAPPAAPGTEQELTKLSASPQPAPAPPPSRPSSHGSVEHTELIILPIKDEPKAAAPAAGPKGGQRNTMMLPHVEQQAHAPPTVPGGMDPLLLDAPATVPGTGMLPDVRPRLRTAPPKPPTSALPWVLAAGFLVLAICSLVWNATQPVTLAAKTFGGAPTIAVTIPTTPLSEQRDRFIEESGSKPVAWVKTIDEASLGASGDVVWDNGEQTGYLRFNGLPSNQPSEYQYQLFIFDETQRYPVDGGVFDIPNKTGDVVIAIKPKLRIGKPQMFAISIEKPGGVVVSQRERVVLTARIR